MIITISNGNAITVTSGVDIDGRTTVISNTDWSKFVSTNGSFYDGRNGITVDPVNIDVGNLRQWSALPTRHCVTTLIESARIISGRTLVPYIVDQRSMTNAVVIATVTSTPPNHDADDHGDLSRSRTLITLTVDRN